MITQFMVLIISSYENKQTWFIQYYVVLSVVFIYKKYENGQTQICTNIQTFIPQIYNTPGPFKAILLIAREDDFCTSISEERRRCISGSRIVSVIDSVTVCVRACVCVEGVGRLEGSGAIFQNKRTFKLLINQSWFHNYVSK